MAQYLIKDTTLTGIADAIRSKTGSADPIVVSDMASQIEGITGGGSGGGSVEGVHYVTFMSEDGTTELYKRPVADGDDCADPVERGYISAPTKESTAQYNYSHVGWATTPNGAWDENALKAVTKDKTVYAAFASVLRYYTITYYDDDGTTVLKTESLAYGATPSYVPTKSGYMFTGWEPELVSVTGAASYTAQFAEKFIFANASWAEIAHVAETGEAANHFAVGDTKTITMSFSDGTTEDLLVRIVGLDHDDLADGSGKAGISIMCAEAIDHSCVEIQENNNNANGGVWSVTKTRTLFNSGEIWTALPSDLRDVIKSVTKTSNNKANALYTTNDKVWMPSATELGLTNLNAGYVATKQGTKYPFYVTSANRVAKLATGIGTPYATRSAFTQYNGQVAIVKSDGSYGDGTIGSGGAISPKNYGRVLGFCV